MRKLPASEVPAVTDGETVASPSASRSVRDMAVLVRAALGREPGLAAVGVAGLVIALLCLIAVVVRGPFIPPEGKMLDAVMFTFGVAVFTLTVALLLPLAGYSEKARRRCRRSYYIFAIYGLALEPVQAFRGLDPRFSDAGGQVDEITGILFGLTAVLMTVVSVILGLRFFRADVLSDSPVLRLGLRYGAAAVMLSFGVGIIMSVASGRVIGEAGNLMPAHALGVHGIQALPVVGLLLVWSGTVQRPTNWVHIAGIGWLTACTAALIQALLGRPPLEPSVLPVLMITGLAIWAAAGAYLLMTVRARRDPERQLDTSPRTMSRPTRLIEEGPMSISPGSATSTDGLSTTDHILMARYDVWIQTLKNHPIGIEGGVYLSTFQKGRGQHITALDTKQARALGERLIALANEIEMEVGLRPIAE